MPLVKERSIMAGRLGAVKSKAIVEQSLKKRDERIDESTVVNLNERRCGTFPFPHTEITDPL